MFSTAFLLATSMVVGQADEAGGMPTAVRDQLDKHFIGEWSLERTWKGKTVKGDYSAKWVQGRHCVFIESSLVEDGKKKHVTELLGWEAKAGIPVLHAFVSNGDAYTMRWNKVLPEKWTGQGVGASDKRDWKSKITIEWKDDLVRYEDITEGEPWVVILRRK